MLGLDKPQRRRGLRSIVQALVALALLALVWRWTDRLQGEALEAVAKFALAIVAIGTLGYQFENGLRAFKLSLSKDGMNMEGQGADD